MSVTQQKTDLREIIHGRLEKYLDEHPEEIKNVAMGAIRRLSAKMTLRELQEWNFAINFSMEIE